jgi:hypothetical protein
LLKSKLLYKANSLTKHRRPITKHRRPIAKHHPITSKNPTISLLLQAKSAKQHHSKHGEQQLQRKPDA